MSAIEAASVKVATMADGTLRITADIEPRHAQAAFALFGSPGTAMALAALKPIVLSNDEDDAGMQTMPASYALKGGELSILAGKWCREPDFAWWLEGRDWPVTWKTGNHPSATAANAVRAICEVESRVELDHNAVAAERFHALIRLPYMRHLETIKRAA